MTAESFRTTTEGDVNRRLFCKILAMGLIMSPVPSFASRQILEIDKLKQKVGSEANGGGARITSTTYAGHDQIKDYLFKMRHPDEYHRQDIVLDAHEMLLLQDVSARLQRLCKLIGYGNFALLGFDEALRFSRNFSAVGDFSAEECAFLENIFFRDAADYGFYGQKQITSLTWSMQEQDCLKVQGSGNYLFRGDAVEKYSSIRADLGDDAVLTSGIRGLMKQFYLFIQKAERHGGNLSLASRSLAPPGYSFHATGDFDIGQRGLGAYNFTEQFTSTMVFKRLADQGVIRIRYERDNFHGVRYEPWHIKL